MSELANTMRAKVIALEDEVRRLPQVELPTTHHFANGMYARVLELKAGYTIIGKVHKAEHLFILASGKLAVTVDDQVMVLDAPMVVPSKGGVKRAGHALTDCVCINVHRTDLTDVALIEDELIEPDPKATYNALNMVREKVLT